MKKRLRYYLLSFSAPILSIIVLYILGKSYRYKIQGFKAGMIYGLWHGEMFPLIFPFRGKGIYVLISKGFDGDILARVLKFFGFNIIRISSPIYPSEVAEIKGKILSGYGIVFALDGPVGPRLYVKRGANYFSNFIKKPLLMVKVNVDKKWKFPVWDGFIIPYPFSSIKISFLEKPFFN